MTNNMNASNKRVAVEANLSTVRDYLSQQGYQVEDLNAQNAAQQGYSAIVISGADQNIMGIENAQTNAQVINAHGMTPQDVVKQIQQAQQAQGGQMQAGQGQQMQAGQGQQMQAGQGQQMQAGQGQQMQNGQGQQMQAGQGQQMQNGQGRLS